MCILSVVAQAAIDNAKRAFDIDIPAEISSIKKNLKSYKYPFFWRQVKENNDKRHNHGKKVVRDESQRKKFNARFDSELVCPMNCLYSLKIDSKDTTITISDEDFFVYHELQEGRRKSKKVEKLIEDYSLKAYKYNVEEEYESGEEFLLRSDFDQLIKDIRNTYISGNYVGLMSWLINRAFLMTPEIKSNISTNKTKLNKNKSLLFKTLYLVNKDAFLKCFTQKVV